MFIVHRGKAVGDEHSIHACSTKLVAKANVDTLARSWRYTWLRVVFYGGLVNDVEDFTTLICFIIFGEDKE
jgi:hypothetical protein